ncbi:MAG: response regulator [Chitinophagaceae bacterium]
MKNSNHKLVYIVDDDPDDRQIILDAFMQNKYQGDYEFIESGNQLLDKLETNATDYPSLILLDLNMPGIKGLDALIEMRSKKQYRQIPVIVLTTSSLNSDRTSALAHGANCFIRKPDDFTELVSLTDAILKLWLIDISQ